MMSLTFANRVTIFLVVLALILSLRKVIIENIDEMNKSKIHRWFSDFTGAYKKLWQYLKERHLVVPGVIAFCFLFFGAAFIIVFT